MAVALQDIETALSARAAPGAGTGMAPDDHPPIARVWSKAYAAPRVTSNDPAILLVTDFSREQAWTVAEDRPIDDALRDMACAGIRALLVVRSEIVTGLITSYDVEGSRTLELVQSSAFASRREIRVGHIMTPRSQAPTLHWRSICASRVHQLEKWVRNTRATHALLIDQLDGLEYVRGLLSRAHVERSLGCSP